MTYQTNSGCCSTMKRKRRASSIAAWQGSVAVAVLLRGASSNRERMPSAWPGPSRSMSWPCALIETWPLSSTNIASAASPSRKIASPAR